MYVYCIIIYSNNSPYGWCEQVGRHASCGLLPACKVARDATLQQLSARHFPGWLHASKLVCGRVSVSVYMAAAVQTLPVLLWWCEGVSASSVSVASSNDILVSCVCGVCHHVVLFQLACFLDSGDICGTTPA